MCIAHGSGGTVGFSNEGGMPNNAGERAIGDSSLKNPIVVLELTAHLTQITLPKKSGSDNTIYIIYSEKLVKTLGDNRRST